MRSKCALSIALLCLGFCLFAGLIPTAAQTGKKAEPSSLQTQHVFDAQVTIAEALNFGQSKYGERRVIAITGGSFEGPNIKGTVLSGGADWQLVRPDGDIELYARYTLKTDDGHLIQVINRALIHTAPKDRNAGPYVRSVIDFEAPSTSPYDWLNHAIYLGTLKVPQPLPKGDPYVIIGIHKVL